MSRSPVLNKSTENSRAKTDALEQKNRRLILTRRQLMVYAASLGLVTGFDQVSNIDQLLAFLSGYRDVVQPLFGESRALEWLLDSTWKDTLQSPRSCVSFYLTFDDGPQPCSSRIVEALGRTEHKVTFFVIGRNLVSKELRKIAVQAIRAGHELANHSYSHPTFSSISARQAEREIRATHELIQNLIEEAGGNPYAQNRFFRFPYGAPPSKGNEEACNLTLAELNYQIVWWDVDTKDWQMELWLNPRPFSQVIGSLKTARAQDVVLMHDRGRTARQIEPILACVKSLGLTSVAMARYRQM